MQKRIFNRTGVCNPKDHYMINPLRGLEKQLYQLIKDKYYFILHAPRQTGKTTLLHSLAKSLNVNGDYISVVFSVEEAGYRSIDEKTANEKMILSLQHAAFHQLTKEYLPPEYKVNTYGLLSDYIQQWCVTAPKPIVLLLDEIDSLYDDVLLMVLRLFRNGFQFRPKGFPSSVALVGLRDIRDYKMKIKEQDGSIGSGSPFNIKAESFTLSNFNINDITQLYQQYTDETGQVFTPEIIQQIYELTGGQPWLVNALAYEITDKILNRDYSQIITKESVEQGKENLILRRDTHLDSLVDKLDDPRVKPIIAGIISGDSIIYDRYNNDLQYVIDLGIVASTQSGVRISNRIYSEIIPRVLNNNFQDALKPLMQSAWFIKPDGKLDMNLLLLSFQKFYRKNSESWIDRFSYKECGHQLLLMAYLQRVINGGGRIEREMAVGNGRTDLAIFYKDELFVLELKIRYDSYTLEDGLEQLSRYLDTLNQTSGWLILFEPKRSSEISWDERIKWSEVEYEFMNQKKNITIVEM